MTRKIPLWIVLSAFLASGLAAAQSSPGWRGPNRDRLRENLNRLRLIRMTEALDLTEEQAAKIYPVASRIEKDKAELVRQLGDEMDDLRELVEETSPKPEELASRVGAIRRLRRSLQEKDAEFEVFLDANLSEIQVAKYVVFQADFNRAMGERLNRARALMRNRRPS